MQAEVTGLIEEAGQVVGLLATTPEGPLEVRASLVVGADGRHSIVRTQAGLRVDELGAPMDVLWFGLSRRPTDPEASMGRFDIGRIFITLNRGDYWQCGFVIPKGSVEQLREKGLPAFRASVAQLAPFAADRVGELQDWNAIKLLTVKVDRLPQWYRSGLLCIGDAAHTMSPVGGVGINLAIQDAVAAANMLAAAAANVSDPLDPADAALHAKPGHQTRVEQHGDTHTAACDQASGAISVPAPDSSSSDWHGGSS
jgi:2-polyprenyl-6-methoxyphenol hydroxylase-like FAD-dependent oxidoreductase